MTNERVRAIGPVGTYARVAVGFGAVALALIDGLAWWAVPLGLIVVPLAVTVGHAWLIRRYPTALRELGQGGACATALMIAPFLIIPYTSDATWLWLGASMLLAAARGYAGCEVLAISNWLLRRDDTIGCLLFTPIDLAEARWQSAGLRNAEASDHGVRAHHRDEQIVSDEFSCCPWHVPRSLTTSGAAREEAHLH
jgi:hypothetical protein